MPSRRRIVEAVNKLSMTEHETILSLLRLGWSQRRIAREGGHHRATVRRVRREAGLLPAKCTAPIEVPTDPVPTEPQSVPEVATDSAMSRSSAAPFRGFIAGEIAKGRNATAIYQDLAEHHGYGGSYDAVKRFIRKLRKREPKISCRFLTKATPPTRSTRIIWRFKSSLPVDADPECLKVRLWAGDEIYHRKR